MFIVSRKLLFIKDNTFLCSLFPYWKIQVSSFVLKLKG